MHPPDVPPPTSVLVWRAGARPDRDPATGGPAPVCCLRTTTAGERAVVYRSGTDQGVVAVVDFRSDARPVDGHWVADVVVRAVEPPLPRAALLDDAVLQPVFAHLQTRRRLPARAGALLAELVGGRTGLTPR